MDKPLNGPTDGVLANFTRVETFDDPDTHWIRITIDPSKPQLFTIEPEIVSENKAN